MNGLPLWALFTVFSVPTFTAILGVLLNQRSMDRLADRLDHRMERIEHRMERSDASYVVFVSRCTMRTLAC